MDEDSQPFLLRASNERQSQFQWIDFSRFFVEDRARRTRENNLASWRF